MQLPVGLEGEHAGVVDLLTREQISFVGDQGEEAVRGPIDGGLEDAAEAKRAELVEKLADVDEEIEELFLMEEDPDADTLKAAIRRTTLARTFVPVFMGSAYKIRECSRSSTASSTISPRPTSAITWLLIASTMRRSLRCRAATLIRSWHSHSSWKRASMAS